MKRISEFKGYRTSVCWNAETRSFEQVRESWTDFPAMKVEADILLYKPRGKKVRLSPHSARRNGVNYS